jgi:dolichol-phosphate mannosyltransferase
MYSKACEGYDVVLARKSKVDAPLLVRLFSGISNSLFRKFAVRDYPKGGANNFLINNRVKECICTNVESNSPVHMQIVNLGFKRAIVDVTLSKRHKGKTKWTYSKKIKHFIDIFIAFSYMPIRMISLLGIIMFIAGTLYAIWIIITSLTGLIEFNAGFPTLICVLLLGFGLTNFSMGIVAEYIWRTLDASRKRPVFVIDTVELISGEEKE